MGLAQVLGRGELEVVQGEGDGEVEAVVSGLVDDDEGELFEAEVVQVNVVFRGGDEVAELAQFCLEGDFVEELDEVDVRGVRAEVLLQDEVDGGLEHECVVDRDHAHTVLPVPAGLPAAGYRAVHDVVADEEEGLQELGEPPEGAQVLELFLIERRL